MALSVAPAHAPPAAAQAPAVLVDTAFAPTVSDPVFPRGTGPRVLVDEAHHNLYDNAGYYRALRELTEADGYRVASVTDPFTASALAGADLLIVANALPVADQPASDTLGPALTDDENRTLLTWIEGGGNLLLLIDHRPYAHAAQPLLEALGLRFTNGYALDYQTWDPLVFRRADGTLEGGPITDGRNARERVDSVATFDGDAFQVVSGDASALLRFGEGIDSFLPEKQWDIGDATPHVHVTGWLQGATLTRGRGRVVVLGESGMAVAQLVGPRRQPRGMNAPVAGQNAQLFLNAVHWLTRVLR